jgi:uncharacterized membrane protein
MANFDLSRRSLSSGSSKSEVNVLTLSPEEPDSDIEALKQRAKNTNSVFNVNHNITYKTESKQQLEDLLSNLLKYGVLLASAIVLFGGIIYLVHHGDEPAKYNFFRGEPSQFCSPEGVVKAVLAGSDRAIIQLGLLILVAVPILRVITSLFVFLQARDLIYVVITLLVFICLTYSLLGAYI